MARHRVKREPGYTSLALAVIVLAVRDVHQGNGYAADATEFLLSDWGQRLAIELDLDVAISKWLMEVQRI